MSEGNRKDPRARVLNMTVRYKSATVDEFIENHSHDISKGGIFIKTRSPFPAGTLLKFEVRIAEDQKLMHGVGRVVWRREPERAEESFPAGMGIKFIKTGEGAAELISQLVAARQGAESSFDAGVRETGVSPSGAPPGVSSRASSQVLVVAPPHSGNSPALQVENGPRSGPAEADIQVSSPPKKRQDQGKEKRKVVLQGPALDAPPSSKPKKVASSRPRAEEARAPSRELSPRSSIVNETTSPRARSSSRASSDKSGQRIIYGIIALVGVLGFLVWLINRNRDAEPVPPIAATPVTPAPEPSAPIAAEHAPPPPPEPAAAAEPSEPGSAGAEAAAAGATPLPGVPAAPPPAAPPLAAPSPAASPLATPAAAAPIPPPPPPAAAAQAEPKPAVAKPVRAPAPVVPKPRPVAPVPKPKPVPVAPNAAGDDEVGPSDSPPAPSSPKKPTAAAPKEPPPKPSTPPPPPEPAPPPPTDDNPY